MLETLVDAIEALSSRSTPAVLHVDGTDCTYLTYAELWRRCTRVAAVVAYAR